MEKKEFFKTLSNDLLVIMGSGYKYKFEKVYRNNGVYFDVIIIEKKEDKIGKTLVVKYERSDGFDEIYNQALYLADDYENCASLAVDVSNLTEWESSKDLIIFKLINKEANCELLEYIPHVILSDMVMVFMACLEGEDGILIAWVDNDMVEKWGINPNDLTEIARKNTVKKYPAVVIEPVAEGMNLTIDNKFGSRLFVVTNEKFSNGAAAIFYNSVLKELANGLESDLVIIPSSIHEVFVFKNSMKVDYNYAQNMLIAINYGDVELEERLSNNLYVYTRVDNKITQVTECDISIKEE